MIIESHASSPILTASESESESDDAPPYSQLEFEPSTPARGIAEATNTSQLLDEDTGYYGETFPDLSERSSLTSSNGGDRKPMPAPLESDSHSTHWHPEKGILHFPNLSFHESMKGFSHLDFSVSHSSSAAYAPLPALIFKSSTITDHDRLPRRFARTHPHPDLRTRVARFTVHQQLEVTSSQITCRFVDMLQNLRLDFGTVLAAFWHRLWPNEML